MLKKLILISMLLAGCAQDSNQVSYPLFEGDSITFGTSQKLTIINYWAVWCGPCRKEIPEFNQFAKEHADQVVVLAVNFDGSEGDALRAEIAKLGIEFPSLLDDPRGIWGLEPVNVLPETLVIGTDGKLLHRMIGPQTAEVLEGLL
jgi:thiol-disulfide isomerase/thioredoxin